MLSGSRTIPDAAEINPGNQNELEWQSENKNRLLNIHALHSMQGRLNVGWKDGQEQQDETPTRDASSRTKKNSESSYDFSKATDVDQRDGPRQIAGHH